MALVTEEVVVQKVNKLFVPAFEGSEGTDFGIRIVPSDLDEYVVTLLDHNGKATATNKVGDDGVVFSADALKELRDDIGALLGLDKEEAE